MNTHFDASHQSLRREWPGGIGRALAGHVKSALRRFGYTVVVWGVMFGVPPCGGEGVARGDVYVNNVSGDDRYDGTTPVPFSNVAGPVRSLAKAVTMVRAGDSLHIANTGEVYYGRLSLNGPRFSGTSPLPFVVEGNGAVISGLRRLPEMGWKFHGNSLWSIEAKEKGTYRLVLDEKTVPESPAPARHEDPRRNPPEFGSWYAWRGTFWYRSANEPFATPRELPFCYADDPVGISVVDVHDVEIRNLTVRHFRFDGICVHDRSRNVVLKNVTATENGLSGFAVSGSSLAGAVECRFFGNAGPQVFNRERAQTELVDVTFGEPPAPHPFRIRGGHLLIDGEEVFNPK